MINKQNCSRYSGIKNRSLCSVYGEICFNCRKDAGELSKGVMNLPLPMLAVKQDIPDLTDYDPNVSLYEIEKQYMLKALNFFKGNKTKTAGALGITIKTLYNKLHEYGEFENFAIHDLPYKRI